ncbi:MAG: hypothetical protein CL933_09810 [Deltaproteobacteria bacterium]|nr:hypothetical protein [Deltaproteobacteria bacterium]
MGSVTPIEGTGGGSGAREIRLLYCLAVPEFGEGATPIMVPASGAPVGAVANRPPIGVRHQGLGKFHREERVA